MNKRVVSIMITIIPGIAFGESDDVGTLSFGSEKKKITRTPSSVSRFLPVVVSQMAAVPGGCERPAPGGDYRGRRSV